MPSSQAGPKAPVNFSSSIVIADSAIVTGDYPITVSSESVIHPRAKLDSGYGPVNIGRRCIVHERSHIGAYAAGEEGSVSIADLVVVEVGAVIETGGTTVGEGTVVGAQCRIESGASIGKVSGPTAVVATAPIFP